MADDTRQKQACDGRDPCARCARLAQPCYDRQALQIPGQQRDGGGRRQQRGIIKRVHTGCLSCKKRRKKCDETKPRCADCKRLCLPCLWTNTSSSRSPPSNHDSPETASQEGITPDNNPSRDDDDADDDDNDIIWSPASPRPPIPPAAPPSLSLPLTTLPGLPLSEDRTVLDHFIHVIAPTLAKTCPLDTNPYLIHLLPIALDNTIVLHSILALSAMHWRRRQPRLAHRGQHHQSIATQALAKLLPEVSQRSAAVALSASLVLCMADVFDGHSTAWKVHLSGAKRLLLMLQDQASSTLNPRQRRFLGRLYQYLDSAATTSTCRPPLTRTLPDGEYGPVPEQSSAQNLDIADDIDEDSALYGIPRQLFHLVDRVNTLAYQRKFRVDDETEVRFQSEVVRVRKLIESWSYEHGGIRQAVRKLCPRDPDAQHASLAFTHALHLRLHQLEHGYDNDDALVQEAVAGIVEATRKIRYGSPLEPCLVYPLVMAAGACNSLHHYLILQDRLTVMEMTCGFGYVHGARDLAQRVWERRESSLPGTIVNWARIRFEEMDGLVVF